ncbi:MAG TPA: 4-hydroxy-tetrahydrodipicolinate reductase [Cyclobacteriaceae bacterium]
MRVLLIGYGKMGRTIEGICHEKGHDIAGIIDWKNQDNLKKFNDGNVDVAIEFTEPEAAFNNIKTCLKNGIKTISGTTGWLDQLDEIKQLSMQRGAFLHASNFSIGVNIFLKVNQLLARLSDRLLDHDIKIEETHHFNKKDSPSGTAITVAQHIIKVNQQKNKWIEATSDKENELSIKSHRIENVFGIHEVIVSAEDDLINLKHTALSRKGFAKGAVSVAEWISDKNGFYTLDDFLGEK